MAGRSNSGPWAWVLSTESSSQLLNLTFDVKNFIIQIWRRGPVFLGNEYHTDCLGSVSHYCMTSGKPL